MDLKIDHFQSIIEKTFILINFSSTLFVQLVALNVKYKDSQIKRMKQMQMN